MALIRTQVAVVGGGMVGLATACELAQQGKQVCVIELGQDKQIPPEPTLRVSALGLAAQRWFETLGAWQHIPVDRQCAYQGMQVWDRHASRGIVFTAEEGDMDHLGTLLENAVMEGALWQRCQELGVQFLTETSIQSMTEHEQDVSLELNNGDTLLTQLVVAADGANSWVRGQLDVPLHFKDYEQSGLVATLTTERPHQQVARQLFLSTGPLALLPLADPHTISIVWSVPPEEAARLLELDEQAFLEELYVASDSVLGTLQLNSERGAFPLRMRYAKQWVKGRVVLMGDAAHTIHPLAGQGANLGLGDAWYLTKELEKLGTLQGQWHAEQLQRSLAHYQRARKTAAVRHIAAMEGFHQLFLIQNPIAHALRTFGLETTNRLSVVKRFFLKQANQF